MVGLYLFLFQVDFSASPPPKVAPGHVGHVPPCPLATPLKLTPTGVEITEHQPWCGHLTTPGMLNLTPEFCSVTTVNVVTQPPCYISTEDSNTNALLSTEDKMRP